ncbi:hypothetical protein [Zavarzinia sp. CC-PAN008]|uniref:hypothetical protein n=1 Tax=Zavarzinia sp. CC-PAN008 TaxID=3243332 RepID=UPI003F74550A
MSDFEINIPSYLRAKGPVDIAEIADLSTASVISINENDLVQDAIERACNAIGITRFLRYPRAPRALETMVSRPPSLLFCALTGEPNGLEVVRTVRDHNDNWVRAVPIVMVVGAGQSDTLSDAGAVRVNGYLQMPVTNDKVKDVILRVLAKSHRPAAHTVTQL